MRILIALTYYRPHYSGLTIYVERLARALAKRGHHVTVLTSRFSDNLPAQEIVDGVEIIRLNVLARVSKGVVMPSMPLRAWRLIRQADIINVHLPQLDAALIASMARIMHKPVVMTYHCDLRLPSGFIHRIANLASSIANHISAYSANKIVTNTLDYAENSTFLSKYLEKIEVIAPSVEMPNTSIENTDKFKQKHKIRDDEPVIGMLARLATEKGVEYLIQAMPRILKVFPKARILYGGQYKNVLGEEAYAARLSPQIKALGQHWKFLGIISEEEIGAFFQVCDVTVLPSLNSTESFGMVQVESMSCGTPVVASDLPGVRQPVLLTSMGLIVPPGNSEALAQAIIQILTDPEKYKQNPEEIRQKFSSDLLAKRYEQVFLKLLPENIPINQDHPESDKLINNSNHQ